MEAEIKSQELAFEAGRLLLSTRAYTQDLDRERLSKLKGKLETSEEAVVMEKVPLCAQSCKVCLAQSTVTLRLKMQTWGCFITSVARSLGGSCGARSALHACSFWLSWCVCLQQSIVKILKAALLHHGICPRTHTPCFRELDLRLALAGIKDGKS